MADALGLTGAHINRTLNRLRDDGIAAVENQRLLIRDFDRLAALAGTPA
jgi:CRP-like cAMP-binding protein